MATVAGVNAMVGASIFINPATLQTSVGPAAIITYMGVIAAVWVMALALARVAALYPQEGAFYTYASAWGGHTMGIIASMSYIAGLTLAMGLLTRLTGMYLAHYFPAIPQEILSLGVLWALVALNMAGAVLTKAGQIVLIILTLAPVALIIGLCLTKADTANLFPFMPYGYSSLIYAIKAVIFGFFGLETAAALYNVVEHPEKNVPRALTLSIGIVGALYLAFVTSIFLAIPRELFTSADIPLAQVLLVLFPQYTWLVDAIQASIIITIAGTLHALIWALGELLCAVMRRINPHTPLRIPSAVLLVGIVVTFNFLVFKQLSLFFNLCALFLVFSYACSIAALVWSPGRKTVATRILGYAGLIVAFFIMGVALFEILP